jgi:hypothetical protein
MEGVGNPGMDMPLSTTEFAHNIVQQTLDNPNPAPPQELDPALELIWAQDSLTTHDHLDLVFPSNEVILEAMTGSNIPWDAIHHRSYFLPELRRVEAGDFTTTMNVDATCHVNTLAMHKIYTEANMENIDEMIPNEISNTPGIIPSKRFRCTLNYLKSFVIFFPSLMRKCQGLTLVYLNTRL